MNQFQHSSDIEIADKLANNDWNFSDCRGETTKYSTHGIYSYTSKFIPQIPKQLISLFSTTDDVLIDPFCGSGTTLVEANFAGIPCTGMDINPIAVELSRLKCGKIAPNVLRRRVDAFLKRIERSLSPLETQRRITTMGVEETVTDVDIPQVPFMTRLYSPRNLARLAVIRSQVLQESDPVLRSCYVVSFLAVVRKASLLTSAFGNDYVPRKVSSRVNPYDAFSKSLRNFSNRLQEYQRLRSDCEVNLLVGDSRKIPKEDNSYTICITHPPYISAVPYAEYFKLELLWLKHNPLELDRRIIGGQRGSKDVVDRYMEGMVTTFSELHRILRPNSLCLIVIGNPRVNRQRILLNDELKDIGMQSGFRFIHEITRKRVDTTHAWLDRDYIIAFRNIKS